MWCWQKIRLEDWFPSRRTAKWHWSAAHCIENLSSRLPASTQGLSALLGFIRSDSPQSTEQHGSVPTPGSTSEQRRHLNFSHWILHESACRLIKAAAQSCVTLVPISYFLNICSRFCEKARFSRIWSQSSSLLCDEWQRAAACHSLNNQYAASPLDQSVKSKPKRDRKLITLSLKTTHSNWNKSLSESSNHFQPNNNLENNNS